MKFAHYYKKAGKHFLIINADMKPIGTAVEVASKREARAMAQQAGAKPWNF